MLSTVGISDVNNSQESGSDRIFIIGGGIVGASLAYFLSKDKEDKHQVILIDKSLDILQGSTGHAPGFVGQLNESSVLTILAKDSVSEYIKVPNGFSVVGGLELSSTPDGIQTLHRRKELALSSGLLAELITPEKAASLAPDFIHARRVKAGLHFASDGTADAQKITSYYIHEAQRQGVQLLEAEVTGFSSEDQQITTINSVDGSINLNGSRLILATGIWTETLTKNIIDFPVPIIPVAHPYTFTHSRPRRSGIPYPFVRWLDHHVYARDHGDHDGLGSYDHPPLKHVPSNTAIGAWPSTFESVLSEAAAHLKNGQQFLVQGSSGDSDEKKPFNGIFSVTPDNLPLAGKVPGLSNLWLCAAIWVTTAAGTAKLISRQVLGKGSSHDEVLMRALCPSRFEGVEAGVLEKQALAKYNDIYNRDS